MRSPLPFSLCSHFPASSPTLAQGDTTNHTAPSSDDKDRSEGVETVSVNDLAQHRHLIRKLHLQVCSVIYWKQLQLEKFLILPSFLWVRALVFLFLFRLVPCTFRCSFIPQVVKLIVACFFLTVLLPYGSRRLWTCGANLKNSGKVRLCRRQLQDQLTRGSHSGNFGLIACLMIFVMGITMLKVDRGRLPILNALVSLLKYLIFLSRSYLPHQTPASI